MCRTGSRGKKSVGVLVVFSGKKIKEVHIAQWGSTFSARGPMWVCNWFACICLIHLKNLHGPSVSNSVVNWVGSHLYPSMFKTSLHNYFGGIIHQLDFLLWSGIFPKKKQVKLGTFCFAQIAKVTRKKRSLEMWRCVVFSFWWCYWKKNPAPQMLLGLTDPGWDPTVLPSKFGEKNPWKYNQAEKPDVFFWKTPTSIPWLQYLSGAVSWQSGKNHGSSAGALFGKC